MSNANARLNFKAELDLAGYATCDFGRDYPMVVELPTKFIFVAYDECEGDFLIGKFHKSTLTKCGEFDAYPLVEGIATGQEAGQMLVDGLDFVAKETPCTTGIHLVNFKGDANE